MYIKVVDNLICYRLPVETFGIYHFYEIAIEFSKIKKSAALKMEVMFSDNLKVSIVDLKII